MSPHATDHHDVVIVGARAAGAATAVLLARLGHRVLVLDRTAYGSDTLSTHALMRGGVLQLHRWGLLHRIVAEGTPAVDEVLFRFPDGDLPVPVKPAAGVPALYAPRRTLLDRVLVDAARDAGADVRFGASVVDLVWSGDRVGGVAVRHEPDRRRRQFIARGTYTIGADGMRSLVAREVAAQVTDAGTAASAFVYGYVPSPPGAHRYEFAYAPGASAGYIPTNAGEAVVFAGATPVRFRREVAGDLERGFRRILADASPDLAARVETTPLSGPLRGFPGLPGRARRPWGPGWLLVGDAGYWTDPLGAHGLTAALRDAELAARAIHEALTGQTAEHDALARYEHTRDELAGDLLTVLDEMAAYRWDIDRARELLLDLSTAMRPEVTALAALGAMEAPAPSALSA